MHGSNEAKGRLSLFGGFRLFIGDREVRLRSPKQRALLAYLVLAFPDPQPRSHLMTLLWGSRFEEQARQSLRQALSGLRREVGTGVIVADRETVSLVENSLDCDAARLLELVEEGSRECLLTASRISGEFLRGLSIEEEAFEEWLARTRQRLTDAQIKSLQALAQHELQDGCFGQAIAHLEDAVRLNEFREDSHCLLMSALVAAGRRAEALRHADSMAEMLRRELGVELNAELAKFLARIRGGNAPPAGDVQLSEKGLVLERPSPRRVDPREFYQQTIGEGAKLAGCAGREAARGYRATLRNTGLTTTGMSGDPKLRLLTSNSVINDKPSIAVLPLTTLGPISPPRYLADGIAHEIVACLSSLQEMFVISSNSTITLSKSVLDSVNLAQELGVRYLLSGTISQVRGQLRAVIELSDSVNHLVLWSDQFEFTLEQTFDVQKDVATKVAHALLPHVSIAELGRAAMKPPQDISAYDYLLQAMYRLYRPDKANFESAHRLLEQAIACDPNYARANAMMAKWWILRVGEGRSADRSSDSDRALQYALRALECSTPDPLALSVFGHVQSFLFAEYDRAVDAFERAIAVSPNSAIAWALSAPTYCFLGEGTQAIERAQHALLLSPLEPHAYFYRIGLTFGHYINGTYPDAVFWGRKILALEPRFIPNLRTLTASLVALDELDEARHLAAEMMKLVPDFRVGEFCRWYPLKRPEQRHLLKQHLLAAGLPR